MRRYGPLLCLVALVFAAAPRWAGAAIMGLSGAVTAATPPSNVGTGQWESDTQIRTFQEQQSFVLPQAITVDISVPGTSPNSTNSNLSTKTIPAGTVVNSYYLHFDPVGTPTNPVELTGSITVGEPILGLIVESASMNSANTIVGMANTTYPTGSEHGLELNPAGGGESDIITLESNNQTVDVDWRSNSSADDARIITLASPVPEPATVVLPLLFTAFLFARRRRRGDVLMF